MLFTDVIDDKAKDKKPSEMLIILTGIDEKIIKDGVEKHGYTVIMANPSLLEITEEEKERVIAARKIGDLGPKWL